MFWNIFDDDFWDFNPEDFALVGATIGLLEQEKNEDEPVAEDPDEDADNEPT
jgi:hypothetical protein